MRKGKELQNLKSKLGPSAASDEYSNKAFMDFIESKKIRRFQALNSIVLGGGGFINTVTGPNAQVPPPSINPVTPNYLTAEDGDLLLTEDDNNLIY